MATRTTPDHILTLPGDYRMSPTVNLKSMRARKVRLWMRIGGSGYNAMRTVAALCLITSIYCLSVGQLHRPGYLLLAAGLLLSMVAIWYRYDLSEVPLSSNPKSLDAVIAPTLLARLQGEITPRSLWQASIKDPGGRFMCSRLLLSAQPITDSLSTNPEETLQIWQNAMQIAKVVGSPQLHAGTTAAALILNSPAAAQMITEDHLKNDDVIEVYRWLDRQLGYISRPRSYFGGVGRDWAAGFTPTLEQFGQNISHAIESWGGYGRFAVHGDVLGGVSNSLARGAAVALIGPDGVGKSELVFALADRLLSGQAPDLRYYQIVSLDASAILASSNSQIERLVNILFSEAIAARNIIIYLDEAQLFFNQGVGALNMSQLLLPILKAHNLKVIASFTPKDWQHIRAANESLAGSFTPVTLNEPSEPDTFKVVEDSATMLEIRSGTIITYPAIKEAIRLSGQYMQEDAFPGKAIALLEQAAPYATRNIITNETVQLALEKMRGVRVSTAQAPEAAMLLSLEDRIHERMIDQVQAVTAIASALRRSRAGVGNPKRPVGSFLFLGPTGVGKTELARSLAAVYYGDEHQMIRLDMSEYQNTEDVARLLHGSKEDDSNVLTAIRQQPFSVVLLDEIEKAHPNILNLMLQMLDEGQLTDAEGRPASFRSAIIIATSNAGATSIIGQVRSRAPLDDAFQRSLLDQLISTGTFKPELINRFDEVVLFRPLETPELEKVAQLMISEVNHTLETQNISVQLTPEALAVIIKEGYDPEFGARPMRRVIQKTVENAVASRILRQQAQAGTVITLDVGDLGSGSSIAPHAQDVHSPTMAPPAQS
jgi:ATP-dependent Clp protease ATP-binding subunit ClpC